MAVNRNTVSIVLVLVAAICLVSLIAVKWAKKKETFIEHFYDEKEYAMRQAVMNAFDTLIKRKATPKEIEKYTNDFNSVDEALTAIKKDFHIEDFSESVVTSEVSEVIDITEEESYVDNETKNETIDVKAKLIAAALAETSTPAPWPPSGTVPKSVPFVQKESQPVFKMVDEKPITEQLVPEPALLPPNKRQLDTVALNRAELRTYVNEMRTFLNYLEARTA